MLTTKYDLMDLAIQARNERKSVLRHLFDTHIYKHVTKKDFVSSSKGHNNSMVQIADHGLDHIKVRIKTKGVSEKIGG